MTFKCEKFKYISEYSYGATALIKHQNKTGGNKSRNTKLSKTEMFLPDK